ncbi:MAG: NAD(P)H-binding protein [Clostridia bacterium]
MLLVTGITGHSGKYFLKELIEHKYDGEIRCLVRATSDTSLLDSSGLKIEKRIGNLDDPEFIDQAMVGIDTVMHIGSIFYSINVMKAVANNKVRRAIFVHTTGIYSKYKSAAEDYKNIELSIAKIIEENTSKIGLIYLRPTMIYGYIKDGNMIVFIKMVDKLRLFPVINHGESLLQPVNGRDLGKAYYQVLSNQNIMQGDYILSGEKPIKMLDMFKLISEYLNKKTRFISFPLGFGVFLAMLLKGISLGRIDHIEKIQRMGENRSFSHESASRDFNYLPMSFAEGLKMEIQEYLS